MKPVKELVKDPEWQKIRKSLLGQWKQRPEWCCAQLRKYLGSNPSNEKLRIVMNYVTGTGFRTKRISHPCIDRIKSQVSMEMKKRKAKGTYK